MTKLRCRFLGHQEADFTDSGYAICTRCGAHGYYDFDTWKLNWLWPPLRWWLQLRLWWEEYREQRERKRRYHAGDDLPF